MENGVSQRFDDIVRSERYFTATLLPAILFHDWANRAGIREFVNYLEEHSKTERTQEGKCELKSTTNYNDFKDVELITEFHIRRDLEESGLIEKTFDREKRDAPDLVIISGRELVVCEGKFFHDIGNSALKRQINSQRLSIRRLFDTRYIRAYRHVAIVPREIEPTALDVDAVVTWAQITKLATRILGAEHYVTQRLEAAVANYNKRIPTGVPYSDGNLPFEEMRERCRSDGDAIHVGHDGGESSLRSFSLTQLEQKMWRWRDPATNRGKITPGNWLPGGRWLEIVEGVAGNQSTPTESPQG